MDGVVHYEVSNRNQNRISTTVPCVFVLVTLIICIVGVPLYFYLRSAHSQQNPCHESLSVPLSKPIFHLNGSVEDNGVVYPEGYYFTKNGTTSGCLCVLKPCIRKCCDRDEHLVKVPYKPSICAKKSGSFPFNNFSLPIHNNSGDVVNIDQDHFRIIYGDVCFHGKYLLDPGNDPRDKHDLMVDGRIRHVDGDYMDISKYCFESMNGSEEIRTLVCFPDPTLDDETKVQLLLYPIAMMVSIPFLMATIFVYTVLPTLRNLHGKSLTCQCTSLLVTYIGLSIVQLSSNIHGFWCALLAYMVQFAFLAAFFWLNIMSFDIWWTFSGLRPPQWGLKATEDKKFLLYSVYAWGVPAIIVATSVAVDLIPGIPNSFIKPGIGDIRCWFSDWKGTFLYFYLPSGILMILNTVMFITTAVKLQVYTKNDKDQDRFYLYLKLFMVMGLNWTLEQLSFFVGGPKSIWFVTDTCNALQGVVIFFFFVCKRKILHKLNKKFCPRWNMFKENSPGHSKSPSSSTTLNKMENDVLDLKNMNNVNNSDNNEESPTHIMT